MKISIQPENSQKCDNLPQNGSNVHTDLQNDHSCSYFSLDSSSDRDLYSCKLKDSIPAHPLCNNVHCSLNTCSNETLNQCGNVNIDSQQGFNTDNSAHNYTHTDNQLCTQGQGTYHPGISHKHNSLGTPLTNISCPNTSSKGLDPNNQISGEHDQTHYLSDSCSNNACGHVNCQAHQLTYSQGEISYQRDTLIKGKHNPIEAHSDCTGHTHDKHTRLIKHQQDTSCLSTSNKNKGNQIACQLHSNKSGRNDKLSYNPPRGDNSRSQRKPLIRHHKQHNLSGTDKHSVTLSGNNTINCKLPCHSSLYSLIDTGASVSIISRGAIVKSNYLRDIEIQRVEPITVTIANGTNIPINEMITFEIMIGSVNIQISAYIVETLGLFHMLIGSNTLADIEGVIDIKNRCLTFRSPRNTNFKTMYATTLDPYQTKYIKVFGKLPPHLKNAECMLKTTKFSANLAPALSLHRLHKGQTTLIMRNPTNKRIKIHKNACVASIDFSGSLMHFDKITHFENSDKHTIMFASEINPSTNERSELDILGDIHVLPAKDVVTLREIQDKNIVQQFCTTVPNTEQQRYTVSSDRTILSKCSDCCSRICKGKSLPACTAHVYKDSNIERKELANRKREMYPFLEKDDPKLYKYDEEILFEELPLNSENSTLPPDLKELLRKLILNNKEAFSLHGETGNADYTVKLRIKPDARPKYVRPYVASEDDKKVIDREIRKLELMKILVPGTAQHVSPLLLVNKKDTPAKRICSDLRQLNSYILPNPWPYTLIRDTLKKIGLSGATFFSSFDIKDAFHSLKLHPDSQEWCGISSYHGGRIMRYARMPQGCSSSSSEWTRYIEHIIDEVPELRKSMDLYVDDLILYDADVVTHLENIEKLLKLFKKHGLKLSPKKAHFFVNKITYLGHVITVKDGKPHVAAMRSKCDAIRRIRTPRSAREVRSFVGMTNYLSMYLPKLQTHLSPLYELTRKNAKFKWEERHENAFTTIKRMMESPKILSLPQKTGEFRLYSDTSRTACGGCLIQVQDGVEKIIAFHSKSLPASAKNYSVTCLELTGVYLNVLAFNHILKGNHFKVVVDHSALVQMVSSTREPPTLRLKKLFEKLSAFSFDISYMKGSDLSCVDLLSRYAIPRDEPDHEITPIACPVTETLVDIEDTPSYNELVDEPLLNEYMQSCLNDKSTPGGNEVYHDCSPSPDSSFCNPVTRSSSSNPVTNSSSSNPVTGSSSRPVTRSLLKNLKMSLPKAPSLPPLRGKNSKSPCLTPSAGGPTPNSGGLSPSNGAQRQKSSDQNRSSNSPTPNSGSPTPNFGGPTPNNDAQRQKSSNQNTSCTSPTTSTGAPTPNPSDPTAKSINQPMDKATYKARKKVIDKMSTKKLTKLLLNHMEEQRKLAEKQEETQNKVLEEVKQPKNVVVPTPTVVRQMGPTNAPTPPSYTPSHGYYPLRSNNQTVYTPPDTFSPQRNKTSVNKNSVTTTSNSHTDTIGTGKSQEKSQLDTQLHDPFEGREWSRRKDSLLVEQMKRSEGSDNANIPFSSLVPRHTNGPQPDLTDELHSSAPEEIYYKPQPLFEELHEGDIICKKVPRQQELNKILKEIKTRCLRDFSIPLKTAEIKREQAKDPYFKDIYAYLSSGILPSLKRKARSILVQSEQYILVQNVLFKCDLDRKKDTMKLTLCIPDTQAQYIISLYHESLLGSHQGVHKCYLSIRRHYYVPNLYDKLYQFLRSCVVCQQRKVPNQYQNDNEYTPRIFSNYRPFSEIHLDVKKMFPSSMGHEHLLVMNCVMTRYTICVPLRKADAISVTEALLQKVVFTFGPPSRIVMDLATYNTAKMLNHVLKCLDISPVYVSKHNKGSLTTERQIRSVSELLLSQLQGYGKNWHVYTNSIAYSYNTFCHSYMGFSPFEMAMGREPPEVLNIKKLPEEELPVTHQEYVDALKERLQSIGQTVLRLQTEHQEKQLQDKKSKCKPGNTFTEGQLVMLLMPAASDLHTNSKGFVVRYCGPLKVKEVLDDTHYILCDLQDRLIWGIHHRKRLKPAFIRTESSNVDSMSKLKEAVTKSGNKNADTEALSAHSIQIVDEWENKPTLSVSDCLIVIDNIETSPELIGEGAIMSATCRKNDAKMPIDLQPYRKMQECNHSLAAPTELSKKQLKKQHALLEVMPTQGTPMDVTKARYKNGSLQLLFCAKWTDDTTLRNFSCWVDVSTHPNLNEETFMQKHFKPDGICKSATGIMVSIHGSKHKFSKELCY